MNVETIRLEENHLHIIWRNYRKAVSAHCTYESVL